VLVWCWLLFRWPTNRRLKALPVTKAGLPTTSEPKRALGPALSSASPVNPGAPQHVHVALCRPAATENPRSPLHFVAGSPGRPNQPGSQCLQLRAGGYENTLIEKPASSNGQVVARCRYPVPFDSAKGTASRRVATRAAFVLDSHSSLRGAKPSLCFARPFEAPRSRVA
jgi:hypothetical protein